VVAYLKTKEKSGRQLTKVIAVAYGSGRLQELSITEFKGQFKWGSTTLVAYEGVRILDDDDRNFVYKNVIKFTT